MLTAGAAEVSYFGQTKEQRETGQEVLMGGVSHFGAGRVGHNSSLGKEALSSHLMMNLALIMCSLSRASRTPRFRQVLGMGNMKLTTSSSHSPQRHFVSMAH